MKNRLFKFKVGLAILGLFTVMITWLVITQAGNNKQDIATYNSANTIAMKLQTYTDSNFQAPNSLADAGIFSVPPTITYTKLSFYEYRFCVYYKSNSDNYSAASVEQSILSHAVGSSNQSYQNSSPNNSTSQYLLIDPTHHKGNNCQTIEMPQPSNLFFNQAQNYSTN